MLTKDMEKRIDEWIDSHEEEYLRDLGKLIAVPSVAKIGVAEGEFPFGENSAAALKTAKDLAESYGFKVENRNNFCLVANVGEGEEKVGILGHLDVVPCGNDWNFPPYELTLHDGMITGRGVLDDKGPLWASVFSVRCLKELGLLPRRAVEIFMGGDEECGMEDIKYYRAHSEKLPVVSFTPDGRYPVCHGEKGIMRFSLMIPNENSNIESLTGGTVRNVVADHAEMVLTGVSFAKAAEALVGKERISLVEEGDKVKVVATGAAVHASTPDRGVNAIGVLASAVLEAGLATGGGRAALEFIARVNSDCHGAALGVPLADEPSGALTHVGGVIKTAGDKFDLTIDIRYPVTADGDVIFKTISDTVAPFGATLCNLTDSKCIYTPAQSEVIKTCMETIDSVFHREGWTPYTMGGGTYARNMPSAYALGPKDPDAESPYGPYRGSIHQPDETTTVKLLMDTAKVYARLLIRLDELEF